jgi:hypothetical protein
MQERVAKLTRWLLLGGGALAALFRVVPHPANFAPVGALGLYGGAKLRSWQAFALPVAVMIVSDLALWVLTGFDALFYVSFVSYVAIGRFVIGDRATWGRLAGASVLGSLQFFFLTNFFEWYTQPLQSFALLPAEFRYTRDFSGLAACFAAAVPFLKSDFPWSFHAFAMMGDPSYGAFGTILGDLCFTGMFFALHGALARQLAEQPAEAALESSRA